jgi:hypothetical protein
MSKQEKAKIEWAKMFLNLYQRRAITPTKAMKRQAQKAEAILFKHVEGK